MGQPLQAQRCSSRSSWCLQTTGFSTSPTTPSRAALAGTAVANSSSKFYLLQQALSTSSLGAWSAVPMSMCA